MHKAAGATGRVCSTTETFCTFQLPWEARRKVYLSAINAVGRSNPTEAQIHLPKGKPDILTSDKPFLSKNMVLFFVDRRAITAVSAQAHEDKHLLVEWRSLPYADLKDIVVEWRPLLKTDLSFTHFEIAQLNQTSLIIKGNPALSPFSTCCWSLVLFDRHPFMHNFAVTWCFFDLVPLHSLHQTILTITNLTESLCIQGLRTAQVFLRAIPPS